MEVERRKDVTVHDFQVWTEEHDRRTGWNRLSRVQLVSHLLEEVGELARSVNRVYEYRGKTREEHLANMRTEVVDTLWFVFKLASRFGVDVEQELSSFVSRADSWTPDLHGAKLTNGLAELSAELAGEE